MYTITARLFWDAGSKNWCGKCSSHRLMSIYLYWFTVHQILSSYNWIATKTILPEVDGFETVKCQVVCSICLLPICIYCIYCILQRSKRCISSLTCDFYELANLCIPDLHPYGIQIFKSNLLSKLLRYYQFIHYYRLVYIKLSKWALFVSFVSFVNHWKELLSKIVCCIWLSFFLTSQGPDYTSEDERASRAWSEGRWC